MGDFEQGTEVDSTNQGPKSRWQAVLLLILGLFAPIMMIVSTWSTPPTIDIMSMFWMYSQYPYMPSNFGFSLIPSYALTVMFPFLLLRMMPVYQVYRYYNGKTTRKRALIASFVGDGAFLVYVMPMLLMVVITGLFFIFYVPLPFQMIVGFLILWRRPLPKPTTPWESEKESKSWWEKEPELQSEASEETQEKPTKKDDDDFLW